MQLQESIRFLERYNQQSYSSIQSLKDVSMTYATFVRKIEFERVIRYEQQEKFQIFQSKALRNMILNYYGLVLQKSQEEIKFINYVLVELEILNQQIDQATSMWRKQEIISQQISMTMEAKIKYLGQRLKKNNDKLTQIKKYQFLNNIKSTYEGVQFSKKQQSLLEQGYEKLIYTDSNNIILNQDLLKTMQLKLAFQQNQLGINQKIEKQVQILKLKISRFQHLFILKHKHYQQKSLKTCTIQQNQKNENKCNQYFRKMLKEQVQFSGKPIRPRKSKQKMEEKVQLEQPSQTKRNLSDK